MNEIKIFGEPKPGENYTHRHVTSAVIIDGQGQVAVVLVGDRHFLPGGGIEAGETEIEALVRELREECAREVVIGARLGDAVFYQYTTTYGGWCIHSAYYRADFGRLLDVAPEPNHTLMFLEPYEARARLFRKSDVWAVTAALSPALHP